MKPLDSPDVPGLIRLSLLGSQRALIEEQVTEEIAKLRAENVAWRWIGFALGVSTQAAWQRYGNPYGDRMVTLKDQGTLPMEVGSLALRAAVLEHSPDHQEKDCHATSDQEPDQDG